MFSGLSPTIPDWSATDALNTATLPIDSITIYSGAGTYQSVVTKIPYGNGQIYMLGWDWYNAAPQGNNDGGWLYLLKKILQS